MHADPTVTYVMIAINVLVFLGAGAGGSYHRQRRRLAGFEDCALFGPAVAGVDWWRLITSGFLHPGSCTSASTCTSCTGSGRCSSRRSGHAALPRAVLRLAAGRLVRGAAAPPNAVTVGASGAVFGLMGAAFVMQRARGIDPMQTGLGPVILLNLAITFLVPNISIGGHLGGLIGGAMAALR